MNAIPDIPLNTRLFSDDVLNWIRQKNLWNLWVPGSFGGMESSLSEGLSTLQSLAYANGSLGWTVTLCAGANFFIGNLPECTAEKAFRHQSPIFGGSGGTFGTATRLEDGTYKVSGKWRYATGAPYLSHFTLNAHIMKNNEKVYHQDGSPVFSSFVLSASDVTIIEDWNTMGLRASATHSFLVDDVIVPPSQRFQYNELVLPHPIFKIDFSIFADLTLWINYLGMANRFIDEARLITGDSQVAPLAQCLKSSISQLFYLAEQTERLITREEKCEAAFIDDVHKAAKTSVKTVSEALLALYPRLGIRAASEDHPLNQTFRDYFTATQHHIFSKA